MLLWQAGRLHCLRFSVNHKLFRAQVINDFLKRLYILLLRGPLTDFRALLREWNVNSGDWRPHIVSCPESHSPTWKIWQQSLNWCNYSRFKTLKRTKPNQKKLKYKTLQKHGLIHVGKESREEKVQLEILEDNRDNQQRYSFAFFDQHCCLSSKNSLSNLFSQYKISLYWRNTKDVSSFTALAKTVAASPHKRWRKNIFQVFDTDSDMKVHALHYAN